MRGLLWFCLLLPLSSLAATPRSLRVVWGYEANIGVNFLEQKGKSTVALLGNGSPNSRNITRQRFQDLQIIFSNWLAVGMRLTRPGTTRGCEDRLVATSPEKIQELCLDNLPSDFRLQLIRWYRYVQIFS